MNLDQCSAGGAGSGIRIYEIPANEIAISAQSINSTSNFARLG